MLIAADTRMRNGPMFRYRLEMGLNQREAAERAGIGHTTWNALEVMRFDQTSGLACIRRVAELVGVSPEELVPAELRKRDLRARNVRLAELPPDRLLPLKSARLLEAPNEDLAEQVDRREEIERVLKTMDTLTYREREIVKLRYGIGDGYTYTLEEVGKIFKITRDRVRSIEAKAMRKMQLELGATA